MHLSKNGNQKLLIPLLIALIAMLSACANEEYAACSIPKTAALKEACYVPDNYNPNDELTSGSINLPTCASDNVFDCDSRLCAVFIGSKPFCTKPCTPAQCPFDDPNLCKCTGKKCVTSCPDGGACLQFVGSEFYCVPQGQRPMQNTKKKADLIKLATMPK